LKKRVATVEKLVLIGVEAGRCSEALACVMFAAAFILIWSLFVKE